MTKIENLLDKSTSIEEGDKKETQKQKNAGKLTARQRIDSLLDEDSFIEIDKFAGLSSQDQEADIENKVIGGYGTVDGRLVYVYAQDYRVESGAIDRRHAEKVCKIHDMALKMGAPIVSFLDSAGGKIEEGVETLESFSKILFKKNLLSGVVPQIAVVAGPAIGANGFAASLSDFTFMVEGISFINLNGASIVKGDSGEEITQESLGGARVTSETTGNNDFLTETEEEAIEGVRELLSFLPSNNLDYLPSYEVEDYINRTEETLNNISDDEMDYDMKEIIRSIADQGDMYEVKKDFAKNILTSFIRLDGKTVGVVANQPREEDGQLDIAAAKKAARFIGICDSFNIPILTLVDSPGFVASKEEEYAGAMSNASKMVAAYSQATVAKVSLVVRRAYGSAYIAMGSKELGVDQAFAWPSAEISVLDPKAAANILYKEEIGQAANPTQARVEKIEQYKEEEASPYKAAEKGYIDDIIFPSMTRPRLISAFDMLESKREDRPAKKHINLPL